MREVCFCGWSGHPSARRFARSSHGHIVAACPSCGRLDDLEWFSQTDRQLLHQRISRGAVYSANQPGRGLIVR
jgi:hypothetical protein